MNTEWDIPFLLTAPFSATPLDINLPDTVGTPGYRFKLDHQKCSVGAFPLRTPSAPIPQRSGTLIHRQYRPGAQMHLAIELWVSVYGDLADKPAWHGDRRAMSDLLSGYLHSLEFESDTTQRIQWTPSDYGDDRMLDHLRLLDGPHYSDDGIVTVAECDLWCPAPYAIDKTETTTVLTGSSTSATLHNAGTSEFWPVFKAHGPATTFSITNSTTGKQILYDSSLPGASAIGAGHYVEIDCFRETCYLDGDVASRKAGIDMLSTDFFTLEPGDNDLVLAGDVGSCDVLWNNAWA